MRLVLETSILKAVSRSFYLSLRFLPAPMRRPASIAYLLARASDTIADSAEIPAVERLGFLSKFLEQVLGEGKREAWPDHLLAGTPDPRERVLLKRHEELLQAMDSLNTSEVLLIRKLLKIVVSGQELDLKRFGDASSGNIVSLNIGAELDDYTWRVAGCVGVFWTKLGYETLGENFSIYPEAELLEHAAEYGKGLQLVNILRDLPIDLTNGRCYLPVINPTDRVELMDEHSKWRDIAFSRVSHGLLYSEKLRSKRLRIASGLPAMIAEETLEKIRGATFEELEAGIKISRGTVYRLIVEAWFHL